MNIAGTQTASLDRKVVSAFCLLCVYCVFLVCPPSADIQGKKQNSSIISDHVPLLHAGLAQSLLIFPGLVFVVVLHPLFTFLAFSFLA